MYQLNLFGAFSLSDSCGVEIPLKSKKAKALLAYLALSPGKPRSREKIMALLWSDRGDAQARASLRQVLTGLRKELGENGERLLCIDADSIALDPDKVIVAKANGQEFLSGLHITDPAFDDWLRDERHQREDAVKDDIRPAKPPLPEAPSIAVLPFQNLSGDPKQEYLSDGITEDIITTLSKIPKLFVIARSSTATYKERAVEVEQIGQEQGVRYILQGSVRKADERLRITAQLIDTSTGHHIWAQRYDQIIQDLFELQDEITRCVVLALQVELTEGEQARIWAGGTKNHAAWEIVTQISELMYGHRKEDVVKGREFAEQALLLDDNYASAWNWLGWSHFEEAFNGWSEDQARSIDLALQAVNRSREIDETNPDTFALLGLIELCRRNFDQAHEYGQRAMKLGPSNAFVFGLAAIIGQYCNNPLDMGPLLKKAMRLCPIYPAWFAETLGWAYLLMNRHADAISSARDAVRIDSDYIYSYFVLAVAYTEGGRREEAADAIANILRIEPGYTLRTFAETQPFRDAEVMERHLDGLSKAGLPGCRRNPPL